MFEHVPDLLAAHPLIAFGLVFAALCRAQKDAEVFFNGGLADILIPIRRAQGLIERAR